jgi:hypothetical protein
MGEGRNVQAAADKAGDARGESVAYDKCGGGVT